MMTKKLASMITIASLSGLGTFALADEGPCKQIKEACTTAGFIKGDAKDGKGLWMDCVNPIMQGTTAKKSVLPLPKIDAKVVADCKQKKPKFGEGKVGN